MIKIPEINLHLGDCMDLMRGKPDGYYSLSIVDPPYGIGANKMALGNGKRKINRGQGDWDSEIPPAEYFIELFRVSKNQIIWGANHMTPFIPPISSWIYWDKGTGENDFSDGELAYCSIGGALRSFKKSWVGANARDGIYKERIHPTQKPVALYKWLLENYAKPGDRILDTHGGSGSSMIACYDLGFDMDWIELDPDYFKAAKERFERHKAQGQLFHIAETLPEQQKLF